MRMEKIQENNEDKDCSGMIKENSMNIREFQFIPERKTPQELFIRPESPEQPLIKVVEKIESLRYEAIFSMKLAGVNRVKENTEDSDKMNREKWFKKYHYINHLISCLSEHQELDFVYKIVRNGTRDRSFSLNIIGHSSGESTEVAYIKSLDLWQNLNVVLGSIEKSYHFMPVKEPEKLVTTQPEEEYIGIIKPLGITLCTENDNPLGFKRNLEFKKNMPEMVILPNYTAQKDINLNSVIVGANGWNSSFILKLTLKPFRLSHDQLDTMASARKLLQRGEIRKVFLKGIEYVEENEDAVRKIINNLELWLKNPTGYRVICTVASRKPIPLSFLTMVGNEIFGSYQVSAKLLTNYGEDIPDSIQRSSQDNILDISDCINNSSALPPLFPEAEILIEAGAKKIYSYTQLSLSETGILLGSVKEGMFKKYVHFAKPDRSRHCYIIGSTGTGKSTLLYNMIVQDIENGEGVTVIDPHGDLYQQVLNSIPKSRAKDVVLVNLCDFDYSVGINFLECKGHYESVQRNYIVNELIKIFDRLYDLRQTGGPIFEMYMRSALLLVMDNEYKGATLMDVPLVFEDREYRNLLLSQCQNPVVVSFWKDQAERAGGESSLENLTPYVTSKLNQFTMNALLRPIIGQPKSTIDFREIMDKGKILLVNLSKGLLGELDTQLLGMLIIGKIFSSAMSRVAIKPESRRTMFLYVDEFQNFMTDTVSYLISESRKFGIYLTLANQNLSQLSANSGKQNILDSVIGNVGNILMFRLGATDAEKMQAYTKPELMANDLQTLPNFHVAGRLLVKNSPTRTFVFKTLPMRDVINTEDENTLIHISRQRYATPTKKVEMEIFGRWTAYKKREDE